VAQATIEVFNNANLTCGIDPIATPVGMGIGRLQRRISRRHNAAESDASGTRRRRDAGAAAMRPLAAGGGICGTIDQEACVQITGIGLVNSQRCCECIERSLTMSFCGERWLLAAALVGSIHRQSITMLQGGASSIIDRMIAKLTNLVLLLSFDYSERA
jgi:hypothetical protein